MSFAAWIKIETTTPDKPEVIAMATRLGVKDSDLIVGKLVRLWGWADANSVDGREMTITRAWIDRYTGLKGFARALEDVGWLSGPDGAIEFANFERHNGESAKRRAMETRKKQRQRGVGQMSRCDRDKAGDQEEEIDKEERERAQALVNSLRVEWSRVPVFSAAEEEQFRRNLPAMLAFDAATWDRMRRFLAARMPEGSPAWQPTQRRKLLETITEVAAQAEGWERKQQDRKPPPPPKPLPDTGSASEVIEDPAEASRILRGEAAA